MTRGLAVSWALAVAFTLTASAPASAQTFRRPTACSGCIGNYYYFDRNGSGGGYEDWNCMSSSYDYHRGTDFSLSGSIDGGYDVVAAADGTVVSTLDGNYDRCNTCDASVDSRCGTAYGTGYGNHVVIDHGGTRVFYAHMRNGSVRVGPGDSVSCGDVIGQIGSSGCSTGAHLHFEARPGTGSYTTAFDPYAGGCSATSPSRWTAQNAYRTLPGAGCDGSPPPMECPAGTYAIWTCNGARTQRRRCIDGNDSTEDCPYGCLSMPVGTDDVCAPAPDADSDGYGADVDCDDDDGARHPGAIEVCGDSIDQDCDGSDLLCPGVDAGVIDPGQDGALAPRDAAVPPGLDAGRATDAGDVSRTHPRLTGACGCRAAGRGGSGGAALLLLVALCAARLRRAS